jgi:hypothetical protein
MGVRMAIAAMLTLQGPTLFVSNLTIAIGKNMSRARA